MVFPFRFLVLLLCVAPWVACSDRHDPVDLRRAAVTEGTLDPGDDAVVAIGNRRVRCEEEFAVTCTGTVIAPRVVLTAAHCVDFRSRLEVFFGAAVDEGGSFATVVNATPHPDFDDDSNANDIALLVLDREAPVPPVEIVNAPLDPSFEGQSARVVGFGLSGPEAEDTGTKREGTSTISSVDDETFVIVSGPSMTCQGDSGGPVFVSVDGEERLAGVTSWGDLQCATEGVNVQVGAYRESFIDAVVATVGDAPDEGDGPELASLCEVSCDGDDDCPSGMTCERGMDESRCALEPLPPGSLEEDCERDDQCSEQCVRIPGGASCRCFASCNGSVIPPAEDAGPEAAGKSALPDIVDYAPSSGCAAAGSRRSRSSAFWVVAPLLVFGLSRRRRRYSMP